MVIINIYAIIIIPIEIKINKNSLICFIIFQLMHNQTITDDSESSWSGLDWTGLQRKQKGPCHTSLYLLALAPVAARIKFKTLMLAYRTTTDSAPTYFHSLMTIYIPSRSPAYFHSLLRIYIPSRSPAYFHSLLRIYIPSRSPAYFHSLLRIYIPSRSPAYFHSLLRIYIPSRSPVYFHSLLQIYIPSRSLRSATERRLVVPSQRGTKSLSRTF